MELLKDYNVEFKHYPGETNVVVDALSRKTVKVAVMLGEQFESTS